MLRRKGTLKAAKLQRQLDELVNRLQSVEAEWLKTPRRKEPPESLTRIKRAKRFAKGTGPDTSEDEAQPHLIGRTAENCVLRPQLDPVGRRCYVVPGVCVADTGSNTGAGLFATKPLKEGTAIPILGKIITEQELSELAARDGDT